jgi:hypothetical protein
MHPAARVLAAHHECPDRHMLAVTLWRVLAAAGLQVRRSKILRLIDQGQCSRTLASRIAATLPPDVSSRFLEALHRDLPEASGLASALGLASTRRGVFRPHLWILHERARPKAEFVVALTGPDRWKRIELPENIERCSKAQQRDILRRVACEHFRQEGHRDGLFGRTIGYVYRSSPARSYRLTIDGRLDSLNLGPFMEPRTRASVHLA